MNKIKTVFCVCLAFFAMFLFVACVKSPLSTPTTKPDSERIYDELVEVYKVTYNNNGTASNFYSSYTTTSGAIIDSTEEEYNNSNLKRENFNGSGKHSVLKDKSIPYLDGVVVGSVLVRKQLQAGIYKYYKTEILSIEIEYIAVKIIDNRTIIVKTNAGQQTISTDYFNVEYFNI